MVACLAANNEKGWIKRLCVCDCERGTTSKSGTARYVLDDDGICSLACILATGLALSGERVVRPWH